MGSAILSAVVSSIMHNQMISVKKNLCANQIFRTVAQWNADSVSICSLMPEYLFIAAQDPTGV